MLPTSCFAAGPPLGAGCWRPAGPDAAARSDARAFSGERFSKGLWVPSRRPLPLGCLFCPFYLLIESGDTAAHVHLVPCLENTVPPPFDASVSKLSVPPLISIALLSLWPTAIWAVLGIWEAEVPSRVSGQSLQVRGVTPGLGPWVRKSHIELEKSSVL